MGILLMKTSYSTIFNEGLDFTCALADAKGDMIACAEFCPTMIGGMPLLIKTCAQEIDFATLEDGDVIIHNDPYRGGLHCPSIRSSSRSSSTASCWGFAVCIGHIAEIGGNGAGRFLRRGHRDLPRRPARAADQDQKAGKDVDEVWKLMLANVRTPRQNYGDLRAMIGSVDPRRRAHLRAGPQVGRETFQQTCEDLMDYSERRMRAELSVFPTANTRSRTSSRTMASRPSSTPSPSTSSCRATKWSPISAAARTRPEARSMPPRGHDRRHL